MMMRRTVQPACAGSLIMGITEKTGDYEISGLHDSYVFIVVQHQG